MDPKKFTALVCCTILYLLIGLNQIGMAQEQLITGSVLNEEREPIPGVTELVKGTANGTTTDLDGQYSISVLEGSTLVFSFIGFQKQEIALKNQSIINVTLVPDFSDLDEVIVVGYGTVKTSDLTGSVS